MNRAAPSKSTRKPTLRQLLRKEPRMGAAQGRRLNDLIDRSKEGKLSARERRELDHLVETVDRQSFIMVANALLKYLAINGRGLAHSL